MPPSKGALSPREREKLLAEVAANVVFEHAVIGALVGAGIAGASYTGFRLIAAVFGAGSMLGGLLAAVISGLTILIIFFIMGLALSALVVSPLHKRQIAAKVKERRFAPFAGAVIIATAFGLIAAGLWSGGGLPSLTTSFSVILGSGGGLTLFKRRMTPIWREADRADAAAEPTIIRLH